MSVIKKLAPKIDGYRKETILTPTFMLGEVALECIIPYVMATLIDEMTGDKTGNVGIRDYRRIAIGLISLGVVTVGIVVVAVLIL